MTPNSLFVCGQNENGSISNLSLRRSSSGMKKILMTILLIGSLISLNSCRKVTGKGPVVTETRTTEDFTEVAFEVPGDLHFIPSENYEIIIEAQRNILDVIETRVRDGELKIKTRDGTSIRSSEEIRVTVKAPGVHSLSINGSGSLNVLNDFAPAHAWFKVNGSGTIRVNAIETEDLDIRISGSGRIEVMSGSATNEDISISGSGEVDLVNVLALTAKTETSGSGTIKVNVSERLDTKISGSGDVYYKGNPVVNTSISGSGRVVQLN